MKLWITLPLLFLLMTQFLQSEAGFGESIPPRCLQPMDPGKCNLSLKRWYYDPSTNKCKEFYYSGCGGNTNRFKIDYECGRTCGRY